MDVKKADGSFQPFSDAKIIASIKRAGIPEAISQQVLSHVKSKLYNGIPTKEVYHHITEFLGKSPAPFASSKFTLKQAIMDLGPTGYPFEDYVAKLLEKQSYQTAVRTIVMGTCVSHEIDVIAEKNNQKMMVEAKFHNTNGVKTDVQVALYTKARFDDIAQKHHFSHSMLVTNTKATEDATAYALCVGMDLLTWSYPEGNSLRDLVEKHHMYPITSLTSLSNVQKQSLLEQGIVLCEQLCKDHNLIQKVFLAPDKEEQVMNEVHFLCDNPHLT